MTNSYPLPVPKFNGNYLMNSNIYVFWKILNLYISYTLDTWARDFNTYFTLGNCLFGTINLTKNADPDKYRYSGYDIAFNALPNFWLPDSSWSKNVIIFGINNSSSARFDIEKNHILVLGEGRCFR